MIEWFSEGLAEPPEHREHTMAKNTKTQAATELDKVLGEHPCECQRYEIENWTGEVPEGADPGDYLVTTGTGCTQTTTRVFAPGHDAKLKSLLIKAGAEGANVRCDLGGMVSVANAATFAAKYDFGHMVLDGIARAEQKLAAKLDKKAARAAAKPARVTKVRASKKAKPTTVTIKVGRWEYEATIDETTNEAAFTSANGEARSAAAGKYTVVTK